MLDQIDLIDSGPGIRILARTVEPVTVRSPDAIHLATALHYPSGLVCAMEEVFLGDLFPGIIGSGGSLRPLSPCGDGVTWIPSGQETLGESGIMF